MSQEVCRGGRRVASGMQAADGGHSDWPSPPLIDWVPTEAAACDIDNNINNNSGNDGYPTGHNEIMKVTAPPTQSRPGATGGGGGGGDQMIMKIREKSDLGQLVLSVNLAPVETAVEESQLYEPRIEVSLCIKQQEDTGRSQGSSKLSKETCGGQELQPARLVQPQESTIKRRLVYQCIDQFQLSLGGPAKDNKWSSQQPLLPFPPASFDACFCFNLLNVRLVSGRHIALERAMSSPREQPFVTEKVATRRAFEQSWLEMERQTGELRLRLLREFCRSVKPGGKIMIIVFAYECQRPAAKSNGTASSPSTHQHCQERASAAEFVPDQPLHRKESTDHFTTDADNICCPRCRMETLDRLSKNVHKETGQPFQRLPVNTSSFPANPSSLTEDFRQDTNSQQQKLIISNKPATGVGIRENSNTPPSYSSSLRQALGASMDLADSRTAEKLGAAAKRFGRRLSLGGMSLLVRLSSLANPSPQPRKPTEEKMSADQVSERSKLKAAGEHSIDKLGHSEEQETAQKQDHQKLLNDEQVELRAQNNLLSVFDRDEFARRHRQSIAVQSFFTKSIEVHEDDDDDYGGEEKLEHSNEPLKKIAVVHHQQSSQVVNPVVPDKHPDRPTELALSQCRSVDSDWERKRHRLANELGQVSPSCSRGSQDVSCSSNAEDDDDDVDSTTSGWTAPTSGATNGSLCLESGEVSSAPIERSSSSSGQQQRLVSGPPSNQHHRANTKLDNTDKTLAAGDGLEAGDNVCSSWRHANRHMAAYKHPMNSMSDSGEPSMFPAAASFQHQPHCQDHNANINGQPKPPRMRHCSAGAAGEYAPTTDRNNNNNNNNHHHHNWFTTMPTTTTTTNSSLNNKLSSSSQATGLGEPVTRPRLARLEEASGSLQQQQQRRAFSDTEAPHRGAHNSFDSSIGGGCGGTPTGGDSVELVAKNAAAAAVAAGLSLGMARAHLLQTESTAQTSARLIRSAEPTHQSSPAPCHCNSTSTTTTTTTTSGSVGAGADRQPLELGKLVHSSTTDGATSGEMSRSNLIRCVGQATGHRYRPLQDELRALPVAANRFPDHQQWCHSNTFNDSNPNSDLSTTSGRVGGSGGDGAGGGGGTIAKSDTTDKDSSRRTSTLSGISSIYQQEISLFTQHSLDGGAAQGSSTPANSSGALMGSIPELAGVDTPNRYPFLPSSSSGDAHMMINNGADDLPEPPAPSPLAVIPSESDELGTNLQRVAASLRSQLRERFSSTMKPLNAFMISRSLAGESDETSSIQEEEEEEEAKNLECSEQQAQAEARRNNKKQHPSDELIGNVETNTANNSTGGVQLHHYRNLPDAPKYIDIGKGEGGGGGNGLVRAQSKTDATVPSSPLKSFFRSKSSAAFNAFASSFQHQSSSSTTPTVTTVLTRHLAASGSLASDVFESLKSPGAPGAGSKMSNQASLTESHLTSDTPGADISPASGRSPLSPLSVTGTRFFAKIRDKFSLPSNSARQQAASQVMVQKDAADKLLLEETTVKQQPQLAPLPPKQQADEFLRPPIWEDLLYGGTGVRDYEEANKIHLLPPVFEHQQQQQHQQQDISPCSNQEWAEVSQTSMESSCSARSLHSCWFSMPELHALSYESILNLPRNKKPQGLDLFMNLKVGSGYEQEQQPPPHHQPLQTGGHQQKIAGEWPANELYKQIVEGGEKAPDWSLSDLNLTTEDIAPRLANQAQPVPPLQCQPPAQQSGSSIPLVSFQHQQLQHHKAHQMNSHLTKGGTLDDSVCASMHSSLSNELKPANSHNNSRPESQNSTLSNASGALSELNSSSTHSLASSSPVRPVSQPLAEEEEEEEEQASGNHDAQQQQLLSVRQPNASKARAMSLVPQSQQQTDASMLLATPQIEPSSSNRRRSTNACLAENSRPLDPNVAPAAASLKLRLAARRNRVKLTDLHPITFINDHQFLSSMSSLKKADSSKLNAIFNSPVARRLSINAAERDSATAALGPTRASIKIALTGYVYIEPPKSEAASSKTPRRPSLAPDFWRNQALNEADSLVPQGPKRQRAASCAPLGLYPRSVSPEPEAASNTSSNNNTNLSDNTPSSRELPMASQQQQQQQQQRPPKSPTGDVRLKPPSAASTEPYNEQAKRSGSARGSISGSSSSSDDGDLDKLIAQYDRPTSVAGPQSDLHNDQLLRQMLMVACEQQSFGSNVLSQRGGYLPPHQPSTSRRRYSAINLYQRDEDMFVANSMRWPQKAEGPAGSPLTLTAAKTLMTRHAAALAPLGSRPPAIIAASIKTKHQPQMISLHQQNRALLPVMEAVTGGSLGGPTDSSAHYYPVRSIISGSSGRPLATLTRMGSSVSSALVAGVDVEEQLNRLRQQERRSLSGSSASGATGPGATVSMHRPPWSPSFPTSSSTPPQSPPPQADTCKLQQPPTTSSPSSTPLPQANLTSTMSSLILSGSQKGAATSEAPSGGESSLMEDLCEVEAPTEEEEEEEEKEEKREGAGEGKGEEEQVEEEEETPAEELKPSTPVKPRLPYIQEGPVVVSNASTVFPSRFLSPITTQNAPRSPPHSPLSLMATSGPMSSFGLAYSASKSCEPFKQLDTIIEGRGLLLGAEQQADPNYANMLRRLSGNHSRRSSISSVSLTVDEAPSMDVWCRCEMSPGRRRSTLTRIEPPSAKLTTIASTTTISQTAPLPAINTLLSFSTVPTEANKQTSKLLGSASPRFVFSQVRSLAQRTLSNLAPKIVGVSQRVVVEDEVTQVTSKGQLNSELALRDMGELLGDEQEDDAASSLTGSADHSSMVLSLEEDEGEEDGGEYNEHNREIFSLKKPRKSLEDNDNDSSSSASFDNTCPDTCSSYVDAALTNANKANSSSARRESAEKVEHEQEHSLVCHKCNRKIRLGRPEEFNDYQGELEDEEVDIEGAYDVEMEGDRREEEQYDEDEDEDEEEEEEEEEDEEEEEEDEEDEMDLEDEDENLEEGDETAFPGQEQRQHQKKTSVRKRAPGSGKRGRKKRRPRRLDVSGITEATASGDTGEGGNKLYLAVPPRRKYKWHIKRNLAPKLKRQRSFSANYAPEVPITLIPPPRRFSAAPTLTCPHRNKSSSHSSSSLHHTYSIDSSESMITVIPSNRNHEFMRGTSRSSLSCTDGGSLYMLPKSPMSPRSPSRCSPAGLLTPNTSEHMPLSPVSPAGSSAMRMINSRSSLSDIASGRRQSQPELGDQDKFKTNRPSLVAYNAAPANLLSEALNELSFQQQQQQQQQSNQDQHSNLIESSDIKQASSSGTLKIDTNSDETIVEQTVNEFCHKHSKLELEKLIQQLGYLKISESYFSEKSSTLCIVIEVKDE